MTASQAYIKIWNGAAFVEVTGAEHISVTSLMNGISQLSFQVPNYIWANSATWSAYKQAPVKALNRDGDVLLFYGFVKRPKHANPLTVICEGYLAKMLWYPLSQDIADFELDSGKVSDVVTTTLSCQTDEDEDPGWPVDQWNQVNQPRYVIVSDNTSDGANTYLATSNSSHDAAFTTEAGDYTDTQASGTDYWTLQTDALGAYRVVVAFDIEAGANKIVSTCNLLSIKVQCYGTYGSVYAAKKVWLGVYWSHDGTTLDRNLAYWGMLTGAFGGSVEDFMVPATEIMISGQNAKYFIDDTTHWSKGYLIFIIDCTTSSIALPNSGSQLNINFASVEVSYATATFDPVNALITDTTQDTGHDHILSATNFASMGVAVGDKWAVGIGMTEAFARSFTRSALNRVINNDVVIAKGTASDYVGYNEYELFTALCDIMNYQYWVDLTTGDPLVYAMDEDDIPAATVTYTDDFDINPVVEEDDNEYGAVCVQYRDGLTEEIAAVTPSTSTKVKLIKMRGVRTKSEATEVAARKAEYYSNPHYSFEVVWRRFPANFPSVGVKYTFSPTATVTYTDLVCRRLSVSQDGGLGQWHLSGFFGGASTPDGEYVGKQIGQLQRELSAQQSQTVSTQGAHRHSDLEGILGSSEANHVSAAERTAIGTAIQKGGSVTATADLPMGGFVHTGLGAGAANGESVRYEQINHTSFRAHNTAGTTINNTTFTKVPFATEAWDKASDYDAANSKFICARAGVYHFDASVLFTSNNWAAGSVCRLYLYKSGTVYDKGIRINNSSALTAAYVGASISGDIELAVNEYVEVYVYQSSGANINLEGAAGDYSNKFNGSGVWY